MKIRLNLRREILKLAGSPNELTFVPSADPDNFFSHIDNVFSHIPDDCEVDLEELIDIQQLLDKRRQVAVIWSVEDVQEIRPDLDDDQSWAILQQCRKVHDCGDGFTWLLIETVADDMFPEPSDTEE